MAVSGRDMIADIEAEMDLSSGTLADTPLRDFSALNVEDLSPEDEATIRAAFIRHMRRRPDSGEFGVQALPDDAAVAAAMRAMRTELLGEGSKLSKEGRGFVDDHCPCP